MSRKIQPSPAPLTAFARSPEAFRAGRAASVAADSDPSRVENPHPEKSPDWHAWNAGWNSHWPFEDAKP